MGRACEIGTRMRSAGSEPPSEGRISTRRRHLDEVAAEPSEGLPAAADKHRRLLLMLADHDMHTEEVVHVCRRSHAAKPRLKQGRPALVQRWFSTGAVLQGGWLP